MSSSHNLGKVNTLPEEHESHSCLKITSMFAKPIRLNEYPRFSIRYHCLQYGVLEDYFNGEILGRPVKN